MCWSGVNQAVALPPIALLLTYPAAAELPRRKSGMNTSTSTFPQLTLASILEDNNASAIIEAGNWIASNITHFPEFTNMSILLPFALSASRIPRQTYPAIAARAALTAWASSSPAI